MEEILTKIDWIIINDYLDRDLIISNQHPTEMLWVLNYSKTCQYEQKWDDITLSCRGLVIDLNGNIVSRCMRKFFNLEEHNKSEIPSDLPFEAYEKMDGSCIYLFNYKNNWTAISRGSFESDQAIKANEMLKNKNLDILDKSKTYMFEILYNSNRIVVDYGDTEDLVLLGVIDTKTGEEESYERMVKSYSNEFTVVKRYDELSNLDVRELKNLEEDNREGFVIKYSNGFRVKVKFSEYVRLHRILTNVSSKSIWEALRNGDGLDDIVDAVPDEMFQWVEKTKSEIINSYNDIEKNALKMFWDIYIVQNKTLRKDFALVAKNYEHASILFKLYEGNDNYSDYIWKVIKPSHNKPFIKNSDDENCSNVTF